MDNKPDTPMQFGGLQRALLVYIIMAAVAMAPVIYVIIAVLLAIQHAGSLVAFEGFVGIDDALFDKLRTGAWALGGAAAVFSAYLAISMKSLVKKMIAALLANQKAIFKLVFPKILTFLAIADSAAILGLVGFFLNGDFTLLISLCSATFVSHLLWLPSPSWLIEKQKGKG